MKKKLELKGARTTKARDARAAPAVRRVPWSGGLDSEELSRKGGMLLAALYQCAAERGQLLQDMAKDLGVTYGYISQLRGGLRSVNTISDDFAAACAAYLGLNRFQVLMMAGRLTPADLWDDPNEFEREVRNALTTIDRDANFKGVLTHELLNEVSLESQYVLVRLYEKATKKVLLKMGVEPDKVANDMLSVQELQHQQKKA